MPERVWPMVHGVGPILSVKVNPICSATFCHFVKKTSVYDISFHQQDQD